MGSVEEIEYFGHLLKGYEKGDATDGERRSESIGWKEEEKEDKVMVVFF